MKGTEIALKTLWFFLRTALAIAAAAGLMAFALYTSMALANMYIIATDGMKKRAEIVISSGSSADLVEYFSQVELDTDPMLESHKYVDYSIKSYEYKLKVERIWTLPWKDEGTIRATERVYAIEGEMLKEKLAEGQESPQPPAWEDARYEITLTKDEEGRYYITNLRKLDDLKSEPGDESIIVVEGN